jgi:hypothetical protein
MSSLFPAGLAAPDDPRRVRQPNWARLAVIAVLALALVAVAVIVALRAGSPGAPDAAARPVVDRPASPAAAAQQPALQPQPSTEPGSVEAPPRVALRPTGVPASFSWLEPERLRVLVSAPGSHIGESFSASAHVDPVGVRRFDLYGPSIGVLVANTRGIGRFDQASFAFLTPARGAPADLLRFTRPTDLRIRARVIGVDDSNGSPTPVAEVFAATVASRHGSGPIASIERQNAQLALLLALHDRGFDVVQELQRVVG